MTRDVIKVNLTKIFHEVFDDKNIILFDNTTADDIEGWDSLSNITLLTEIERAFNCSFKMNDVYDMKNVGDIIEKIVKMVIKQ